MHLDGNNLYGWAMFQTLPVNSFKWKKKKMYLNLIKSSKNNDEDNSKGKWIS